jgi:hypothetical protein
MLDEGASWKLVTCAVSRETEKTHGIAQIAAATRYDRTSTLKALLHRLRWTHGSNFLAISRSYRDNEMRVGFGLEMSAGGRHD